MPIGRRKGPVVLVSLVLLVVLIQGRLAQAQTTSEQSNVRLYPLEKQNFPQMQAYLDVYDTAGNFISGLTPETIQVIEAGQRLPVTELVESTPGVQFVLAVTYGPAMGIRDGQGYSRYDYLLGELAAWQWKVDQDAPDDISLVVDGGPESVHQQDPAFIMEFLNRFQADPRQAEPSLTSLGRAVEIALDPVDRPGMERVVLFITPPQTADAIVGIQSLSAQAVQAGVRIIVWQVSAEEELQTPQTRQLMAMTEQTGGIFWHFTGAEIVPNIETYLEPLRPIYNIGYQSRVSASGSYETSVEVQFEDQFLGSNIQPLDILLQPPNPMFIALPAAIDQTIKEGDSVDAGSSEQSDRKVVKLVLQELEILVEFPDGYPRDLTESVLLVDQEVVSRNTTPPFDVFSWDLSAYETSNQHMVQVVVTDALGLQGSSPELPVQVMVDKASFPMLINDFPVNGLGIIGLAVLVTAVLVGLVLVLTGRITPYRLAKIKQKQTGSAYSTPKRRTPKSESMDSIVDGQITESAGDQPGNLPGWFRRFYRPQPNQSRRANAFLVPLSEDDKISKQPPLSIFLAETVLGRDPKQTNCTIYDQALEPVHARLLYENEVYRLVDEGSTAGTWVNFDHVPDQGQVLRHGDLVHFGNKAFRFNYRNPKNARRLVVTSLEGSS